MSELGRKIYYQLSTGNVIFTRGEMVGNVIDPTKEQDFASYTKLFDYNPDSVGMVQLEYGQYAEDFSMANGYRVNPDTLKIEFSYTDPTEPEAPPVIRKPLTEKWTSSRYRITVV